MRYPAVTALIAANIVMYLLQASNVQLIEHWFALQPLQGEPEDPFRVWQLVTYAFLHDTSGYSHLVFNMLGLWMFGSQIEAALGGPRLLALYFASVVSAALTQLLVPPLFGDAPGATIGASGGVFGLLLAYAMLFPRRKVVPLIPPIPMPAWLFATLYTLVELFAGVTHRLSGIAHFAHLGGMVGSFLVLMQLRLSRRRR